jgi:hypothetical protein
VSGVALIAGLGGYLAAVDPRQPGSYPTCPFHAITGLWCPGCGSLRAMHDVLHGRLVEALGYNALLMVVLPVAVIAGVRVAFNRTQSRGLPAWAAPWALVVLAVWTVVRNLPYAPFTILAP